jgi:hypothetical protein
MLGLTAVCRERVGDSNLNKFDAQSLPMIAVGRCPNSNGLQFYNPVSGTLVSSIDYKFQYNVTSGARLRFSIGLMSQIIFLPQSFIWMLPF